MNLAEGAHPPAASRTLLRTTTGLPIAMRTWIGCVIMDRSSAHMGKQPVVNVHSTIRNSELISSSVQHPISLSQALSLFLSLSHQIQAEAVDNHTSELKFQS